MSEKDFSNKAKRSRIWRHKNGSVLLFVIACVFVVALLGAAAFYSASTFGGAKQADNANDSGTLAAAQSIMSVCLTAKQAADPTIIPPAFANYGVDNSGNFPTGFNTQGQPVNASGQVITKLYFNSNAYNMCAWVSLLACLRAAKDNSASAIQAANGLCTCLAKFSQTLAADIQNSNILSDQFSNLANSNSLNELPNKLFGSQKSVSLQKMNLGCYVPAHKPSSNIYLPNNVSNQFSQAWLSQIESGATTSSGQPLLKGGVPINANTFSSSLNGIITFIPLPATKTHLMSSTSFSSGYTAPFTGETDGITVPSSSSSAKPPFPYNCVQAMSKAGDIANNSNSSGATNNAPISLSNSGSEGTFSLAVLSNAITGAAPNQASALCGYLRVTNGKNGQDFAQLMSTITPAGYSNIPLSSSTNLAFDGNFGGSGSLFDIFSWADGTKYIAVATDSHNDTLQNIRNYKNYPNCDLSAAFANASLLQDVPPTNNFGGLIDNLALNPSTIPILDNPPHTNIPFPTNTTNSVNTPVMPFIWACKESDTSLAWVMQIFGNWADYNNSYVANPTQKDKKSLDSLNRDPAKDPIPLLYQYYVSVGAAKEAAAYKDKTAPELFKINPAYQLHEGRATGAHMMRMTIADALNIRGIYLMNDSEKNYQPEHPSWADAIIPCICANYGFPYLPQWLGGTKSTFSPIEYAKAQVVGIFGGVGIYTSPVVIPSAPRYIYLPMTGFNTSSNPNPLNPSIASGMKDFIGQPKGGFSNYTWPNIASPSTNPFLSADAKDNTKSILLHHPWNSVATVNNFEQVGSPFQYLYDINCLMNGGAFNLSGAENTNLQSIMNDMLAAVRLMNPNHSMQDLVNALSQSAIDIGQTYYVYDNNGSLVFSNILPLAYGMPGNADGANSTLQYYTTYSITGGWVQDDATASAKMSQLKSLIDTAASGSQRGDADLHDAPYRGVAAYPGDPKTSGNIYAEDMAQWTPGTGAANGNYGDLTFFESVGPSMQFSSIN